MLESDKPRRTRNRARAIPIPISRKLYELVVLEGHSSKPAIYAYLVKDPTLTGEAVPSRSTIYRAIDDILKEWSGKDRSAPWSPALHGDADPVVLAALVELIERTEGRIRTITVAEARCMTRLARYASELVPLDLWRLARVYVGREADGAPTDDLDAYIAFAPWRSRESLYRYWDVREAGRIPGIPQLVELLIDGGYNRDKPDRYELIADMDRVACAAREGRPLDDVAESKRRLDVMVERHHRP